MGYILGKNGLLKKVKGKRAKKRAKKAFDEMINKRKLINNTPKGEAERKARVEKYLKESNAK